MSLIIALIIIGVFIGFIPMDAGIRSIIVGVIAVLAIFWLLGYGHLGRFP